MWIATRILVAPNGETVEISVGSPFDDHKRNVWICPYRYVRNGSTVTKAAEGADAFQALHVALALISREYGQGEFVWPLIGAHSGLPIIVDGDPELLDHKKLIRMIDDEMDRQSNEAIARMKHGKKEGP